MEDVAVLHSPSLKEEIATELVEDVAVYIGVRYSFMCSLNIDVYFQLRLSRWTHRLLGNCKYIGLFQLIKIHLHRGVKLENTP